MRLTWTGMPYVGPKKRPWWLDEYGELPDWLVVVLLLYCFGVAPIVCTALAATGHPVLMMLAFLSTYPVAWFVAKYGHDAL